MQNYARPWERKKKLQLANYTLCVFSSINIAGRIFLSLCPEPANDPKWSHVYVFSTFQKQGGSKSFPPYKDISQQWIMKQAIYVLSNSQANIHKIYWSAFQLLVSKGICKQVGF